MMDIYWGRNKSSVKDHTNAYKRIITIGCFMLMILTASIPSADGRYIEVLSNETTLNESEDAISDRFGYFQGKWNLWEYIGDYISSLID